RLVTQLTQRPTDKMGAEARLHADDARRQLFKDRNERQPLDLTTKSNLAVRAKANDVEDVLADIDANRGKRCAVVVSMGCFSWCCGVVFEDYPRRGSSRSIPLADKSSTADATRRAFRRR
ncbi:hypothetical protein, partial [Bradyrhizobium sp. 157]|uniref:hypothetical protein n=1 Tax=Bradyrhizobium sp. 157 TaxID=2782631 RepID=UPI001FF9404C